MRLRTKILFSMLLILAGLTSTSLLLVRRAVERHLQTEISDDLRSSVVQFKNVQHDRESALQRSAALVANLPILRALMTTSHEKTIQDASLDLWRLAGSDLFLLANPAGDVVGLHNRGPALDRRVTDKLLEDSLADNGRAHWWFGGDRLYEVSIQPIYFGDPAGGRLLGFLGLGLEINEQQARDLSRVTASEVVFCQADVPVRGTLSSSQLAELAPLLSSFVYAGSPAFITLGGEKFQATSVDLGFGSGKPVRLVILKSLAPAYAFLTHLDRLVLGLGLVGIIAGTLLALVVSRTITRPLDQLVAGVRALGRGDYDYPLSANGRDEVAELTAAFGRMRSSFRESQHELLEAERLATIGRMASSISHDLRHHLAAMVANAEFLSDGRITERQVLYEELRDAANQMTDLIDSLLEFSRTRDSLRPSRVRIDDVIARAVQTVRTRPAFAGVTWQVARSELEAILDSGAFHRALQNLLINACEAVPPAGGRVSVDVRERAGNLEIRVSDNGHGVPDSIRLRLFEPFVSQGKENGTGLGLTIVDKIIEDHGGHVIIESTSASGTVFLISLPMMPASGEPLPAPKLASSGTAV
jgi:signal transduction histidine kinase